MMYQSIIDKTARKYNLNPKLVVAVIRVESSFNTEAIRYESHWKWFERPEHFAMFLRCTVDTEKIMQSVSWGLMQVMGTVAREYGFSQSLWKLCRPDFGVEYGCRHLANFLNHYGDVVKALAAYNGGHGAILKDGSIRDRNHDYAKKVMSHYTGGSDANV